MENTKYNRDQTSGLLLIAEQLFIACRRVFLNTPVQYKACVWQNYYTQLLITQKPPYPKYTSVNSPDHRWLSRLLGCEGKKRKKNLHVFGGQSAGSAWEIFHLLDLTKVKALFCPTNQRARSLSLSLPLWHETRFIISRLSHKIPFTVYSAKFLFPLFLSVYARA